MYNGDFLLWPQLTFAVTNSGIRTATGWYVGSGNGGQVTITRRPIIIGEIGLPPAARYAMRMLWGLSYTNPTPPFYTLIESGEAHGAPKGDGVRHLAGQNVEYSVYAKVDSGPVMMRQMIWQSFGSGSGGSPDVNMFGTPVAVGTTWTKLTDVFAIPNLNSKSIANTADDYLGYGLDLGYGAAPGLEIAMACERPL